MDVVQRSFRAKGFSEEVSSRLARPNRRSSLAVYESKWVVFSAWCERRQTDPFTANAPLIAEFLMLKFSEGRVPSTLAGYRTAIAKTLLPRQGVDYGTDHALTLLLKNFEVDRPVARNPTPAWDLSLVLNRLASAPFEPLASAPLKLVTWKTVFLLALASGRRRGEIHALDASKISWKENYAQVRLGVLPSFLSKTQVSTAPPLAIVIPALDASLGTDLESDAKLCPVRALRFYLDKTKGF